MKKTVESGENATPDNEIHVSWIKPLDQNINFYFIALFLLYLEWYFGIIKTHTKVTPD